jgi:aryl-alcohol dehydrogenase-like predicted oxidoreductase
MLQPRPYGDSGLTVPILGFGAMQVGDPSLAEARVERLLHHVLDAGLTLIDTARSYGIAEERIGRMLARRRDEFVLSTKVGYGVPGIPDWTYECIVAGVDAARDRLRTDVIDIVHLHSCPLGTLRQQDVVEALVRCRDEGKIRVAAYSGDSAALEYAVGLSTSSTSPASAGEVAQSAGEGTQRASEGSGTSPASAGEVDRRSGEGTQRASEGATIRPSPQPSPTRAGEGAGGEGSPVFTGVQASVSVCDQQNIPVLQVARARGIGTIAKRSFAGRPWVGTASGDPVHDEYRRRFERIRTAFEVENWDEFALRFAAYAPGVDCVIVGGTDTANVDRNVATVGRGPLKVQLQAAVAAVYEAHGQRWEGLV